MNQPNLRLVLFFTQRSLDKSKKMCILVSVKQRNLRGTHVEQQKIQHSNDQFSRRPACRRHPSLAAHPCSHHPHLPLRPPDPPPALTPLFPHPHPSPIRCPSLERGSMRYLKDD